MTNNRLDDTVQGTLPGLLAENAASTETVAPIAHWSHTLALMIVLGFMGVSGYLRAHTTLPATDYLVRSMAAIISQVTLMGAVVAGIYHRRAFFASTLEDRRVTWFGAIPRGMAVYVIGMIAAVAIAIPMRLLHVKTPDRSLMMAMLPHAWWQLLPWLGVSLCAGATEEIIFRGYLLQQMRAWFGGAVWAIVATSVLFGLIHAYEGWASVLKIAALAAIYGVVAVRTGSLRVTIVAHALQDFLAALFVVARHGGH
jgi:membrane protease YdiL (CAAX protease family)